MEFLKKYMLKDNFKSYLMVKTDLSYHFSFKNFLLDYTSLSFDYEFFNDFCVKKWSVMVEKNICVERILHCVKKWFPIKRKLRTIVVLSQSKHYITTFFLFLANFKNQLKYYNTISLIIYNVEVRKEKN